MAAPANPDGPSEPGSPPQGDGSRPQALLVRRSVVTGRFARLRPDDRQLYFPFVGRRD